jgi:hypothetical protein
MAAVPVGYSPNGQSYFVPLRVLALLRDGCLESLHPEAATAAAWMKLLMGSYKNTPVANIPQNLLVALNKTEETSEWCGSVRDASNKCGGSCTGPDISPTTCTGCVCRGTTKIETEEEKVEAGTP